MMMLLGCMEKKETENGNGRRKAETEGGKRKKIVKLIIKKRSLYPAISPIDLCNPVSMEGEKDHPMQVADDFDL